MLKSLDQARRLEWENSPHDGFKAKGLQKRWKTAFREGFQPEELKKAGINLKDALKLGIPIDSRRRTAHQENVNAIKGFLENIKEKPRRKAKSKK